MRAFAIAGTHSGCGKTTLSIGLAAAFAKKGRTVQPFKAGPDFIDAGLHRVASGRASRNLDLWMCGEAYVRDAFLRHCRGADIAAIEGVMGLFDGTASTAALALVLAVPVVLVLDAYGMAESAAPIIKGMRDWGLTLGIEIKGVIFNRVASEAHYGRLCRGVEGAVPLGYLPRDPAFGVPHRHLGLVVAEEGPLPPDALERLSDAVLAHVDLDALEELSASTFPFSEEKRHARRPKRPVRIAVAHDRAFCFYYEDNLDLLKEAGAEILFFSPLSDTRLPAPVDCVYIGGGYPELYIEALARNESMIADVRTWSESGGALYAECGGLMYLCRSIRGFDGPAVQAAGLFPFDVTMEKKRPHLGYREVTIVEDCILGRAGQIVRGHEFRYSDIEGGPAGPSARAFEVRDGAGVRMADEGYTHGRSLASYIHVHFGSSARLAGHFVDFAAGGF